MVNKIESFKPNKIRFAMLVKWNLLVLLLLLLLKPEALKFTGIQPFCHNKMKIEIDSVLLQSWLEDYVRIIKLFP